MLSKIEVELEDSTLGVSNPKYITRQAEILYHQREKLDEVKGDSLIQTLIHHFIF